MKAALLTEIGAYDIPISYLKGSRKLFSQDFVVCQNLLLTNKAYQATLLGVLFTIAKPNLRIKAPGIELTGEFFREEVLNILIPLWYGYKVKLPVQSTASSQRTVAIQTIPGETLIEIKNLRDNIKQHIVINTLSFSIDGQEQSALSYSINHADGSIVSDISALAPNSYNIEVKYDLVELSIEVIPGEGVYSLRVRNHFKDLYLVDVLTSSELAATIKYQYKGLTYEELGVPDILFKQVEPELVAPNTYTFSYTDYVKFPTTKTFLLFAIRSKRSYLPTIFGPREPQGLDSDRPWFMRLEGILPQGVTIKETNLGTQKIDSKKQKGVVISKNQIRIGASKLYLAKTKDNKHLEGISVYASGRDDYLFPVSNYDPRTGVITLDIDIPLFADIFVEFREIIEWTDYEQLQLNPLLQSDPETILKNLFLVYADFTSTDDDRSLYHIQLPKVVDGEFHNYTLEECQALVAEVTSNGLPIALIGLTETTDEDYYFSYDIRARGGYTGNNLKIVDRVLWDGEDVDITGKLFTFVPRNIVDRQIELEKKWDPTITVEQAELITRRKIESVIVDATRVGMQNQIYYDGEV